MNNELNIIEFVGIILLVLSLVAFVVGAVFHLIGFIVPMVIGKTIVAMFFGGGLLASQFAQD